jgi:hypothetical protein
MKSMASIAAHFSRLLDLPEIAPASIGSERALRPAATYRIVPGDFRSTVSTAGRPGSEAFDFMRNALKPATA